MEVWHGLHESNNDSAIDKFMEETSEGKGVRAKAAF